MVKESDLNPAKAQYGPPTHSTIFKPVCLVTFKQLVGINSPEPYKRACTHQKSADFDFKMFNEE